MGGEFCKITDIAGKKLLKFNYSKKVDISTLSPGSYILKINDGKTDYQGKFIKLE